MFSLPIVKWKVAPQKYSKNCCIHVACANVTHRSCNIQLYGLETTAFSRAFFSFDAKTLSDRLTLYLVANLFTYMELQIVIHICVLASFLNNKEYKKVNISVSCFYYILNYYTHWAMHWRVCHILDSRESKCV